MSALGENSPPPRAPDVNSDVHFTLRWCPGAADAAIPLPAMGMELSAAPGSPSSH